MNERKVVDTIPCAVGYTVGETRLFRERKAERSLPTTFVNSQAEGTPTHELGRIACERGMLSLEDRAVLSVLRGDTTAVEANRLVSNELLSRLAKPAN